MNAAHAVLAPLARRLTHSLDFDATLEHIARLPIPGLADWCLVYVPGDGDARLARGAVAHASPAKESLLRSVWQSHPALLPPQHPLLITLRTRKPRVQPACSSADLDALCLGDGDTAMLLAIGLRSFMVVPMVAHGLMVGALLLAGAKRQRREFDQVALDSATALASCSAQAIYNAQLFWEARLAVRMREEMLSAGSRDLMVLAGRIQRRVSHLRSQLLNADVESTRAVHSALTDIEDLAAAIKQRIHQIRVAAGDGRPHGR